MEELDHNLFSAWRAIHEGLNASGRASLLEAMQASRELFARAGLREGAQACGDMALCIAQMTTADCPLVELLHGSTRLPN